MILAKLAPSYKPLGVNKCGCFIIPFPTPHRGRWELPKSEACSESSNFTLYPLSYPVISWMVLLDLSDGADPPNPFQPTSEAQL